MCPAAQIGVASTKAYTSQIITITMIGLMMMQDSISRTPRRKDVCNTDVLGDSVCSGVAGVMSCVLCVVPV